MNTMKILRSETEPENLHAYDKFHHRSTQNFSIFLESLESAKESINLAISIEKNPAILTLADIVIKFKLSIHPAKEASDNYIAKINCLVNDSIIEDNFSNYLQIDFDSDGCIINFCHESEAPIRFAKYSGYTLLNFIINRAIEEKRL